MLKEIREFNQPLNLQEVADRLENKNFSKTMYRSFEANTNDSGSVSFVEKIDNKKISDSFKHFKSCDISGKFFKDAIVSNTSKVNAKEFFSLNEDNKNKEAIAEIIAIKDYYTEAFMSKGLTPDGRLLSLKDFYTEMKNVKKVLQDNYNIGGALTVTQQSIIWAALEILPTEPSIHEYFTVGLSIKPGDMLAFPFAQFNSPGGLDYGSLEDLLSVNIGTSYDSLSFIGQAGIKVQLGYDEMNRASFDLLFLHFQAAKNALQQWKSMKAINTIHNNAVVDFDNLDPANSTYGETTGVSLLSGGGKNGTLTMRDINKILLGGIKRGHNYDIALISPEGWEAIMAMPELADYIMKNHKVMFPVLKGASGTVGRADEPLWKKLKNNGSESAEFNRIKPVMPVGFTDAPLTWIVTKHVPTFYQGDKIYKEYSLAKKGTDKYYIDSGTGLPVECGVDPVTSIYLIDSKQALFYAESRPLSMMDREDDWKETYEARLTEAYSFVPIRQGEAIRVIKNITISQEPTVDLYSRMTFSFTEAKAILAP